MVRARAGNLFGWLRSPNARWLTVPLLVFLYTRVTVFYAAYVPMHSDHPDFVAPDVIFKNPGPWGRWDSNYYVQIARDGYNDQTIAFFPTYPLLIRYAMPLVGGNGYTAGVIISNIGFLIALMFLYRLFEMDLPEDSWRALFYVAAFPSAFFFSAPYTESLFLLFSVMAVYFARRRWWLAAAIAGALASATRIPGIFVTMILVLEWLAAHGWTLKTVHRSEAWRRLWQGSRCDFGTLLLVCLSVVGLLAYMAYLSANFGGISHFFQVQADWGAIPSGISNPLSVVLKNIIDTLTTSQKPQVPYLRTHFPYYRLVEVAAFLVTCMMSAVVWRRINERYALYCLCAVLLPGMSRVDSMVRFMVVLFPLAMPLALWGRNPVVHRILTCTFMILLGICMALFAEGFWIG